MLLRILICSFVAVLAGPAEGQMWLRSPRVYDGMNAEFRAAGDFDGDGDQDVLRAESTGFLRVMWNDGTGQLAPGPTTPIGATPFQVLARDLTGDGILDAAYTSGASVRVHPGVGGGAFGAPIVISLPSFAWGLACGDADGDGPDDLATWYYDASSFQHVAWIVGNGGGFTVHPGPAFPAGSGLDSFAVVDIGNDGVDDLASVGLASGSVATVTLHPTVAATPGLGATFAVAVSWFPGMVAGDVDADGDDDLLVTSSNGQQVTVVLLLNAGPIFTPQAPQVLNIFNANEWGGPYGLYAHDMNGDGAVELFARGGASSSPHCLITNGGTGTFAFGWRREFNIPGQGSGAGFIDMNGDGFVDFVGPCEIAFGDGVLTSPFGTEGKATLLERDWEDDGDFDYFDGMTVRFNDGRGAFTSVPVVFPPPPPGKSFGFGSSVTDDLDGDGFVDYLIPLSQLNPPFYPTFLEMRLMHGNGDGSASDVGLGAPVGLSVGGTFTSDVDGDGDRDAVGVAGIFLNDGAGFFTGGTASYTPDWRPWDMRDVDADGDDDFLAISTLFSGVGVAVLRRTTPGTIAVEVLLAPASSGYSGVPSLSDVDGDGDFDVLIDSVANGNAVYAFLNTAGVFGSQTQIVVPGPHGNGSVVASDIDGDGLTDLVLASHLRLHVHRRIGPGLVYEPPRTWANFGNQVYTVDVDNDGDQDVSTVPFIFNTRFHGPTAGYARQYGQGTSGSAGFRPVLALQGPIRVGTVEHLRISRAVGGSHALVVLAGAEANIPDFGFPGLTAYVQNFIDFVPLTVGGAAGQPGKGFLQVPFGPLPPVVANLTVFLQVALDDASTLSGFSVTNGLEVHHGP